ncbi:MAG TPA: asparagine synthase (glutamine-hydrolyzing) [Candidatus Omnitrophica bacterium]|nr:asparagine synthase (glutamine-hydrolyzing) [Candidatus Omnitrophota bacterium]
MCGIVGIVGAGAEQQVDLVQRMRATERHRGPDGEGIFTDQGVALGHVRLAVLDLSAAGHQPMSTPDGRYAIVHNGEVYNYLELRTALDDAGPFTTQTDTEVIVRAYARWGPACLDRFMGMFSFAIWDRKARTLFCARDRFGIKPFYYADHEGTFLCASELKAILEAGVPRRPCLPMIYDYLAWGYYEHAPETFFEGIRHLPAGCYLTVRPGEPPRLHRYYSLPDRVGRQPALSEEEAVERLRGLLDETVRWHLRSDVKIGVTLSGGLDSSTLLALVDRQAVHPEQIEVFSCDYDDPAYSERPWVEAMVKAVGRQAHFTTLGPEECWRSLEAITWYQEEPFGGVGTAAWVPLYQRAKDRYVTVLLDGCGLDDILGGYRSHHAVYLAGLRAQDPAMFDHEFRCYRATWRLTRAAALQDVQCAGGEGRATMAGDGSDPVCPECLSPSLANDGGTRPKFPRPFESPLKNTMLQGLLYTKLPRALRFKDRLSMAFSRELRVPFLDHRLVEFCFGLPDHLLIRDGFVKYALRKAMLGMVPDAVRLAPKRVVSTPQREWLAGPLQDEVAAILMSASFASRGVVDPDKAREWYRRFQSGKRTNSFYVWQWLNLELWFRTLIDPPCVAQAPGWSPEPVVAGVVRT